MNDYHYIHERKMTTHTPQVAAKRDNDGSEKFFIRYNLFDLLFYCNGHSSLHGSWRRYINPWIPVHDYNNRIAKYALLRMGGQHILIDRKFPETSHRSLSVARVLSRKIHLAGPIP